MSADANGKSCLACMRKPHVFYEVEEETSLGLDSSVTNYKVVLPEKVTTQIEMISLLLIHLYILFFVFPTASKLSRLALINSCICLIRFALSQQKIYGG